MAENTPEFRRIRSYKLARGIRIETAQTLTAFDRAEAVLERVSSGAERRLAASNIMMVTARAPNDSLYHSLMVGAGPERLPFSLARVGDCDAPAIIAAAVYAGHRYAQELEGDTNLDQPVRHDRVDVDRDRA